MKKLIIFNILVLFILSGCIQSSSVSEINDAESINNSKDLIGDTDDNQDSDVSCEPPSEYACHPVYPGPDDTEDLPPAVCGCTPRCDSGTFLDVGVGEGNNPDGTRKGVFSCK